MKKTLIVDCDGVLYPIADLPTQNIIDAVKDIYRNEVKISGEEQAKISAKTIKENHLGIFNYIREICNYSNYDFGKFCRQLAEKIDYSNIKEDKKLWNKFQQVLPYAEIVIFTNNSREHVDMITRQLFHKSSEETEKSGVRIYDITATQVGGYFYPKQAPQAFSMFLAKIGANAENCILYDDAPRNLSMARQAGIKGVLINQDNTLLQNLQVLISSLPKIQHTRD